MNVGIDPLKSNKVCILTAAFLLPEFCPGEQGQTQINRGTIQGVSNFINLNFEIIVVLI